MGDKLYRLVISSLLFLALCCGGGASGQDNVSERVYRIRDFSGLNTVAGDFSIQPNGCRIAHNIDWGRNLGSISKRHGYDSVSSLSGMDSVVAIYGAYYSDGTQQLIMVVDSDGVGYGSVYASPIGEAHFTGTQAWSIEFSVNDNYLYVDSFFTPDDTIVISYTSDSTATSCEIMLGLVNAKLADDVLDSLFLFKIAGCGWGCCDHIYGFERYEFQGASIAADTAQTVTIESRTTTKVFDYFPVTSRPSFAMYRDVIYIANGQQFGVAYNGEIARRWPYNRPGEPTIVPLTDSGGADGLYRYAFTYQRGLEAADSSYSTIGVLTPTITANNAQVVLKDFQWVPADSLETDPDSIVINVYRTRANPGALDERDSAFYVGRVIAGTDSALATRVFVDSVPDASLGAGISVYVNGFTGHDTTGAYDHRYGAPVYISTDSVLAYSSSTATSSGYGILHGVLPAKDTLGVEYIYTFVDTITGVESDASPPLAVVMSDSAQAYKLTIAIPFPKYGDSGFIRNVYRGNIQMRTFDSAYYRTYMPPGIYSINGEYWRVSSDGGIAQNLKTGQIVSVDIFRYHPDAYQRRFTKEAIDSVYTSEFIRVGQLADDDTLFTDSIRWDSINTTGLVYQPRTPGVNIDNIFVHDGRMFATSGNRLYLSALDTVATWSPLGFISLGGSDAGNITVAYPMRGIIRVLENKEGYNVYQDADGNWVRTEISKTIGCIAPRSHVASPLGHYYLSNVGVVRENEGQYLERTQSLELVSAPLDNFRALNITTKQNAIGFYYDQKYLLCIGDTTYVYDERSNAWATWGFRFSSATYYNTEDETEFIPGDSMYFTRPGDSVLYLFGGDRDNGSGIAMKWRGAPVLWDDPHYKSINKIEIAGTSSSDVYSVYLSLYDEGGDQITDVGASEVYADYVVFDDMATNRFLMKGVRPNAARYFQPEINSADAQLVIDMLDLYYTLGLRPVIQ